MPVLATPDAAVREVAHEDPEPTIRAQADVRHEELALHLEEEEGGVVVGAQAVAVSLDKVDDLVLLETEVVRVRRKRTKNLLERRILEHLVNNDFCLPTSFTWNIDPVAHEVAVDVVEDIIGLRDRSLAIGRLEDDLLAERDAPEPELGETGDQILERANHSLLDPVTGLDDLLEGRLGQCAGSHELSGHFFGCTSCRSFDDTNDIRDLCGRHNINSRRSYLRCKR